MSKLSELVVHGIGDVYALRQEQQKQVAEAVKLSRQLFGEMIVTMRYTHPDWSDKKIKRYIRAHIRAHSSKNSILYRTDRLETTYPRQIVRKKRNKTVTHTVTHSDVGGHVLGWLDGILIATLASIEDGWTDLLRAEAVI